MKKTFLMVVVSIMLAVLSSCASSTTLSMYVSQRRTGIFSGEKDGYLVTVYLEQRETPFVSDGYVGEMKNFLVIRLEKTGEALKDANIFISYDDVLVDSPFTYNPLNGKYTITEQVDRLPISKTLDVEVTDGESQVKLTLNSAVLDDTMEVNEVLKCVQKQDKQVVNSLFKNGKAGAEIRVRLLSGDGKNFYYVGFANAKKTIAYLIDAKTGEILAKKDI